MSVFTTEDFQEVPNLNFDTWTQSVQNWYANADAADSYWASGNSGVTSFLAGSRDPITVRVEGDEAYRGYAAKMSTITGVTLVTSAAGNLFIGTYKTNMTNPAASVSFGRPYTGARPVKLSGYYKYEPHETNEGSVPPAEELPMDECNIYIRLWDADDNEIGFGEFVGKEEVTTYTRFEIDVKYSDETAKPAKMTIVATSSRYGGDFSGSKVVGRVGAGSTLWVDEFELTYYKQMKGYIFVFVFFVCLATAAQAQLKFDREIQTGLFVPKGAWLVGTTLSYTELRSTDFILQVLKDLNGDGYTFKISPFGGYFFADNVAAGLRLAYARSYINLDNLDLDLGDDLN